MARSGGKQHNHKMGSTAIPFLVTALISLVIIGGTALFILDKIDAQEDKNNSEPVYEKEYYTPEKSDSFTLMLILDLGDNGNTRDTFMVLRVVPSAKKYVCVPIASNTLADFGGEKLSVENIYAGNGVVGLKSALESMLGVPVDRYMKMDSTGFQKICDIFGGANFAVPSGVKSVKEGMQFLSSVQMQTLINYSEYKGGEQQRMIVTGSLVASMLNQTDGERLISLLDENFNTVINIIESDISVVDFSDKKKAITYLLENANESAQLIMPEGKENDESMFVVDSGFSDDIKDVFEINSQNDESNTEGSSNAQ